MLRKFRPRLTYANVVSTLCLFLLVGGSAYAAVTIDGNQLKNRSVAGRKLIKNTVTGKEVKEAKLGQVPSSARATTATNALRLGGLGPAGYQRPVRWALVNGGTILEQSGGISITQRTGSGDWWLNMGADVTKHPLIASLAERESSVNGGVQVARCATTANNVTSACPSGAADSHHVLVETYIGNTFNDQEFYIVVP